MAAHIPSMDPNFSIGKRIDPELLEDFMIPLVEDCQELAEEFKEDYDAAVKKAAAARMKVFIAELKRK